MYLVSDRYAHVKGISNVPFCATQHTINNTNKSLFSNLNFETVECKTFSTFVILPDI